MRRMVLVLVASAGLLGFSSVASASSVFMEWVGTTGTGALGGADINVSNVSTETLTLDLILVADGAGVSINILSLRFDTDLGNELNILSVTEGDWHNPGGTRTMTNLNPGIESTQESQTATQEGQLFTFESSSIGTGIKNTSMIWGVVVFTTNPGNMSTDGDDIFSGIFNPGIDAIFDNGGNAIYSTAISQGSVNTAVPEPGVVVLLGIGAGALLLAGRRRSR